MSGWGGAPLDMTTEMLDLVRRNAEESGVTNVELLQGYLEDIPLPDASVDVVISNCVINLAADKHLVLAEAARVLRPGGHVAISDVIAEEDMDDATREDMALWTGCIAGAPSRTRSTVPLSPQPASSTSRSPRPTGCTTRLPPRSSAPESPRLARRRAPACHAERPERTGRPRSSYGPGATWRSQILEDPATIDVAKGWCRLMGLVPMTLFVAAALVVRNLAVADAFSERQSDNQRRAATGLPLRTRRRRRTPIAALAGTNQMPP